MLSDASDLLHINGLNDSHRLNDTIYRYRQKIDRYKVIIHHNGIPINRISQS